MEEELKMTRKVNVKKHQRKKPLGGETTVKRHSRTIEKTPKIMPVKKLDPETARKIKLIEDDIRHHQSRAFELEEMSLTKTEYAKEQRKIIRRLEGQEPSSSRNRKLRERRSSLKGLLFDADHAHQKGQEHRSQVQELQKMIRMLSR